MLGEARQAMLLARVGHGPAALNAREALELATLGGARVLGRQGEIGALVPGMAADLVAFDVHGLDQAGAADLVAALVFCTPPRVALSVIDGRVVVRDGRILTLDERAHAARHRKASARLLQ
jgi:cytosine/adenosine deaminase-related metal-dependent hydrolase